MYVVQHLSVCWQLFIQLLRSNIALLDWNGQVCDDYNAVRIGRQVDLR